MDFFDTLFGMPWHDFLQAWKNASMLIFTKYLFFTIVSYVCFVAVLAISDALETLATYTFYFLCVLLIFANSTLKIFQWLEWILMQGGFQMPKFFQ